MSNVSLDASTVEWNSIRPMGSDSIIYCLQLQHSHGADHEYKTVRVVSWYGVVYFTVLILLVFRVYYERPMVIDSQNLKLGQTARFS